MAFHLKKYAPLLGGTLLALVIWALPNWGIFQRDLPHFALLWQEPGNRLGLIAVIVKVLSPLIVGLIVATTLWLMSTLRSSVPMRPVGYAPETPIPDIRSPGAPMATRPRQPGKAVERHSRPPRTSAGQTRVARLREQRRKRLQKPVTPATVTDEPSPAEENQALLLRRAPESRASSASTPPEPYVLVNLLEHVRITLHAPGVDRVVPFTLNARRVQLLAYLAWKRTTRTHRDKMLEAIFGHGQDDEFSDPAKLSEQFDSHRKLFRRDLRRAIHDLNEELGQEVIPPDIDIFESWQRFWSLNVTVCRVPDIEAVEAEHRLIEQAKKEGRIGQHVPPDVRDACERLLAAYPGDFLKEFLRAGSGNFDPWVSSWVRHPFTQYRDMLLQAIWYKAEYELQAGQRMEGHAANTDQLQIQHGHYERAAKLYDRYATTACDSRFDLKVTFARATGRPHGERIVMSERAMRRALMLYGTLQNTAQVEQIYTTYYKQMRKLSGEWQPSPETLTELANAKSRTSAYRLPAQPVLSPEPLPEEGNA